jgi:tetratricopeptide (TPR) repeat protein
MNRRRGGPFGRILGGLQDFFQEAWSWFVWPFYLLSDAVASLFGRGSALRRRPWYETLIDAALWIPGWIGAFFVWLYHGILRWPQYMRLRDLASGLPALIAAIAAVVIVFALERKETDLVAAYGNRTLDLHQSALAETDETNRRNTMTLAQFYARALLKLKPDELRHRYHVGYLYQAMGDHRRAQGIMDSLAPRSRQGFAPAHIWQGDQLLSGPLTPESMSAAQAHYFWALETYDRKEEIHRRLGELYYLRYRRYNERVIDPGMPSKEMYLVEAEKHYSKVAPLDPRAVLTLAVIRNLRGKTEQAVSEVRRAISDLEFQLDTSPTDTETRLLLAQALRLTQDYQRAATVLQLGMNQRADPRYDEELALTYFEESADIRRRNARALGPQFDSLYKAFVAKPTNFLVVYRYVQALTSDSAEEAQIARESLEAAVRRKTPGQMAAALLAFDYRRRSVPQRFVEYVRLVRAADRPDTTPQVLAGLVSAVNLGHVKTLKADTANQLLDTCLQIWPSDPDLLTANAQKLMAMGELDRALSDLNKALEHRKQDARLHEYLSAIYEKTGRVDKAKEHREKADSFRATTTPLGL